MLFTTWLNCPLDTEGKVLYYLSMTQNIRAIECDECGRYASTATAMCYDGAYICNDCWPQYAEELGLCEECGVEREPIYENNGFTEPEGPSHWEITDYKPCAECAREE